MSYTLYYGRLVAWIVDVEGALLQEIFRMENGSLRRFLMDFGVLPIKCIAASITHYIWPESGCYVVLARS